MAHENNWWHSRIPHRWQSKTCGNRNHLFAQGLREAYVHWYSCVNNALMYSDYCTQDVLSKRDT